VSLAYFVKTINKNYLSQGVRLPKFVPTFVDFDLYYLQDAILIEMDFDFD